MTTQIERINKVAKMVGRVGQVEQQPNNAYLSTSDPILIYVQDAEETKDMFGEDHLQEFGTYLPEELIERYKKSRAEFFGIQDELSLYKKTYK